MPSFVTFSLIAASFLAGVGCEACWLKTSAPAAPATRTLDDRPAPSAEKPSAANTTVADPPAEDAAPVPAIPGAELAADAWTQAAHEGDRLRRAHRFEELGESLTALEPREALRVIAEIPSDADRLGLLRGFFEELAQSRDASAIIALAMGIGARTERDAALAALVDVWTADAPSPLRLRALAIASHDPETGLGMELVEADPPKLELALSWAAQMKNPDGQATLLATIARKMVPTNPAAALAIGSTLTGNRYVEFLRGTLQSWAESDPGGAFAWTAQITDPEIRQAAQESVGAGWARMDDEHLGLGYLSTIPPGPARTAFIRATMETQQIVRSADEVGAWIARLNDPADRAAAQALVEDAPAPVTGIGARLDFENGMVLVSSLVTDSPAGRGGVLRAGDRILAVSQPGEAWVPVSGIDLDGVAAMIRGAAGSAVQLQVASPQPGGYGAPHMVQFIRAPLDPHR